MSDDNLTVQPIRQVDQTMRIDQLLAAYPQAAGVFLKHHMACVGCSMAAFDTLANAARNYYILEASLVDEVSSSIQINHRSTQAMPDHIYFDNLADTIASIPTDSIVSRTIYKDDQLKAIVFAFAAGQELSQHTASVPAMIQILEGECDLVVGTSAYTGKPGTWVHMDANVPHSLLAKTPVKMFLLMV